MDLNLTEETRAKLNDLALRTGRSADELVGEAVDHLASYNDWFERKIEESEQAVARGEVVSHNDVRRWLEAREHR